MTPAQSCGTCSVRLQVATADRPLGWSRRISIQPEKSTVYVNEEFNSSHGGCGLYSSCTRSESDGIKITGFCEHRLCSFPENNRCLAVILLKVSQYIAISYITTPLYVT